MGVFGSLLRRLDDGGGLGGGVGVYGLTGPNVGLVGGEISGPLREPLEPAGVAGVAAGDEVVALVVFAEAGASASTVAVPAGSASVFRVVALAATTSGCSRAAALALALALVLLVGFFTASGSPDVFVASFTAAEAVAFVAEALAVLFFAGALSTGVVLVFLTLDVASVGSFEAFLTACALLSEVSEN